MTAVQAPCDRCGRPTPAEGEPVADGYLLCDDCVEDLAGDDPGAGRFRTPAVTPAEALSEALAVLLCPRRRDRRGKRRRRSPAAIVCVQGVPSLPPLSRPSRGPNDVRR